MEALALWLLSIRFPSWNCRYNRADAQKYLGQVFREAKFIIAATYWVTRLGGIATTTTTPAPPPSHVALLICEFSSPSPFFFHPKKDPTCGNRICQHTFTISLFELFFMITLAPIDSIPAWLISTFSTQFSAWKILEPGFFLCTGVVVVVLLNARQ